MAKNTRLKDLTTDVERILELMETRHQENIMRFKMLEVVVDNLQKQNIEREHTPQIVSPPFQVRNVKLDFPRFDG